MSTCSIHPILLNLDVPKRPGTSGWENFPDPLVTETRYLNEVGEITITKAINIDRELGTTFVYLTGSTDGFKTSAKTVWMAFATDIDNKVRDIVNVQTNLMFELLNQFKND